VNPFRRPRLWARLTGTVLVVLAVWLLLIPVTVAYQTNEADAAPRAVSTLYSWWTSEQDLIYTDTAGADLHKRDGVSLGAARLVEAYRLNCGNTFTSGPHEQLLEPDGPQMCSATESPRRIIGLTLFGLGVLGLLAATRLPAEPERYRNRYRLPYRQRRRLKRGG
jgi:hypothetical protein